jgi:ribosome biogenesis GTPase A
MLRCKGCGALLQYTDPKAAGYSPKEGAEYCQRCFRIMHYGDLTVSMKKGIDPDVVMKRIAEEDALILWVCDLFDFEAGMITGLNRRLEGKDIVMIATKRDLLPQSTGEEKLADFVFSRLKEAGIRINSLIIAEKGKSDWIEDIWDAIDELAEGRKILVMGKANSGKSTLLNRLMEKDELTASRYPGTTMDFNEITIRDHTFIDTPGIMNEHSLLLETEEDDLKEILPSVRIKPQVFQVKGNQSFAIGGLARIDVYDCEKA